MQHALDTFVALAGRTPIAALAVIGLVAFAESLAIVGTFVPAAIVMFGAGALVGHGTLELASTLGVAVIGAVAGDALSYELGRHQQDRVRNWSLFRRYADHIEKGEALIGRHGAVSILVARFTGAVRAFVPLLAGFARMSPFRFYATNVASALLWAPAHILPGVVFGASLHLAEQASGRLAALLLLLTLLVWAAIWIARFTIRILVPLTRALRERAMHWIGDRAAWWARFLRLLLDPERPDSAALLTGLLVLLGSMWLFLGIVEDIVAQDPLVVADHNVFTVLQQLRTEPVDRLMVGITEMGSVGVMLPLIVVVGGWLAYRRCWRTAGYWIATAASTQLMVVVLRLTLGRHRPLALYRGVDQYSFPSGHATISAAVLAWLAFLLTRGQTRGWRVAVAATAAVYVALVGFSRLYLGAHWLSDVLGGVSFGFAAAALSAMVYTQHRVQEAIEPKRVAWLAAATIVIAGPLWITIRAPVDSVRYAAQPAQPPKLAALEDWVGGGFRALPGRRHEVAGEDKEPFTLQVACAERMLRDRLRRDGWREAPGVTVSSVLHAVAPHPAIGELPLLPKFDGGRASAINLMKLPGQDPHVRSVLRLWKSDRQLPGGEPVWYGAFYREVQVRSNYSVLRQEPQSASHFDAGLATAGLQRLAPTPAPGGQAPELWACAGG